MGAINLLLQLEGDLGDDKSSHSCYTGINDAMFEYGFDRGPYAMHGI
jgi:hypothetical protein